ncbi:MAG: hypothetical protein HY695_05835 [Deltaproteobacteria bacterium]|nr:hypothetical protein [Deltaproteobacteria bacterium]
MLKTERLPIISWRVARLYKEVRSAPKGTGYFHENEKGAAGILAEYLHVDAPTALETYRLCRDAYTTDGIPCNDEIHEHLKLDAQILKLPEPKQISDVFDFTLQREVNREIGIK